MNIIKRYFPQITAIAVFLIYLITLAPSVVQIDSGELAAVQILAGIAHPTGYPLYTMLGYLFSKLPLFDSKIFQLNMLAAIYCSLAVGIFVYSAKFILDHLAFFQVVSSTGKKKKDKTKKRNSFIELDENIKIVLSVFSGLTISFNKTFWFQSTSVEVYSLHLFLISLIFLSLLKAFIGSDTQELSFKNPWIVFALVLALGFSNHMTTILIIPGAAYLYFAKEKFTAASFKKLFVMIISFTVVLILIYSYLPLRASQNPQLNWGNPVDFERIIRHVTGFQYQVWIFSSTEAAKKQFEYFVSNLPSEFYFTLIPALIGLFTVFTKSKKFFVFNLINFVITLIYSINYDINDIDSYFLLAFISISFFALFGFVKIYEFLSIKKLNHNIILILILLFPVSQFFLNFSEVNQSKTIVYRNYTNALLNSVEDKSLILSYQWDYFISASYYFQLVENVKPQVVIVDKELLRRSWYYNQLERNHPGILNGVKTEVNLFLEALKPFERKEQYNAQLLENLFRRIITNLLLSNSNEREIYIGPEIFENEMQRGEVALPEGFKIVPHLFLFKVVKSDDYVEAPLPVFKMNFSGEKDKYQKALSSIVSLMLIRRAAYEVQFNKPERAKIYLKKVTEEFPDTQIPPQLQTLILN